MSKHAASGILFNPKTKEVLIVCDGVGTSDEKAGWKWGLAGGKCCDDKRAGEGCCTETPEETIIREFREETGYEVEVVHLLLKEGKKNPETRQRFTKYWFVIRIVGGEPRYRDVFGAYQSPRWVHVRKLPRNMHKSHQQIITPFLFWLIKSAA